jgi:hypothetical protein
MLDALTTAEIQALRLDLYHFANRQSDQAVHSRCLTVMLMLGEVVERDDPAIRADLANSVAQLEKALGGTRHGPYDFLNLVPLTIANARAHFADPIILSFRSCIASASR